MITIYDVTCNRSRLIIEFHCVWLLVDLTKDFRINPLPSSRYFSVWELNFKEYGKNMS